MKAWLCAGLVATASGFGSVPGEEGTRVVGGQIFNPCANPNAFTPDGTVTSFGECFGDETTDLAVCVAKGCRFSARPEDAYDPCSCETQELCEGFGSGTVWSVPQCTNVDFPAAGACLDMLLEEDGETETNTTRQQAFALWGHACCNGQAPICCGDDDIKIAKDSEGAVASCAAGLAAHSGVCSDDMYVTDGAPSGWFQAHCAASCGACDPPTPSPSPYA